MKRVRRILFKIFSVLSIFNQLALPVLAANPYFYITGDNSIGGGPHTWYVYLDTADNTIGALQTVINYDSDFFTATQINTQNSNCTIWSPADEVPPAESLTRVSPYFYDDKIIISCGTTGDGINDDNALIISFTMEPIQTGSTSFSFSDSKLIFNGNSITPGASDVQSVNIISTEATVSATPEPEDEDNVATSAATITTRTLFSDVTFQQWNPETRSSGNTQTTGSNISTLEQVELDNTIPPPPPNMTPRPNKTPLNLDELFNAEPATESGEVKAIQSLRDLLIPGKSEADKTVVIINFISTILFLIILAIILWRMMTNSRTAKLKSEYIDELITGELAALESKMAIVGEKTGKDRFELEFEKSVQHIIEEIHPEKSKPEK